jgi:hypothetical protein
MRGEWKLKEEALDCILKNFFWKRLWTCHKTCYRMNEWMNECHVELQSFHVTATNTWTCSCITSCSHAPFTLKHPVNNWIYTLCNPLPKMFVPLTVGRGNTLFYENFPAETGCFLLFERCYHVTLHSTVVAICTTYFNIPKTLQCKKCGQKFNLCYLKHVQ